MVQSSWEIWRSGHQLLQSYSLWWSVEEPAEKHKMEKFLLNGLKVIGRQLQLRRKKGEYLMNTSLTAKGEIFIQQISNYLFKNREQKLKMLFTKLRTGTRDSLHMRGDCNLTRCFAFRCIYWKLAECKTSLFGSSRIRCYIALFISFASAHVWCAILFHWIILKRINCNFIIISIMQVQNKRFNTNLILVLHNIRQNYSRFDIIAEIIHLFIYHLRKRSSWSRW